MLAVPVNTNSIQTEIHPRCARSPYFAIVNRQTQNIEFIENPYYKNTMHVGEMVLDYLFFTKHITAIATYEMGNKAVLAAKKKQIQIIILDAQLKTLEELLHYIKSKTKQ